ncbi:MAG: serine/threonine protein kinase, partial [Thermoguttaceae bacterium]|nr:serine/threonine protein kinase [Thermoguttaceae bacterium]
MNDDELLNSDSNEGATAATRSLRDASAAWGSSQTVVIPECCDDLTGSNEGGGKRRLNLEPDRTETLEESTTRSLPNEDRPTVISKDPVNAARQDAIKRDKDEAFPPGTEFGHFTITKFIGGGGMGRVYEGVDRALQRKVAIKILAKQRVGDRAVAARFLNEARSAARLNHEHIAQVYFCGEEQGVPYIAFEYVSGANLRDYVRERGVLEIGEAVDYVLQAADALAHAAAHGVTHRDVKPSNIIVTPQKSVKLIDMGLARLLKTNVSDDLTESGVTLGTFDYISPEQARDPRNADVRSDIYSLGCTFYYMLAGAPPFPEGTVLQKLLQHQGDEAPDVRIANPAIPLEIGAVVKKMMRKNPAERYQRPEALIGDLIKIAEMLGVDLTVRGGDVGLALEPDETVFAPKRAPGVCALLVFLAAVVAYRYWPASDREIVPPFVAPNVAASPDATPGNAAELRGGNSSESLASVSGNTAVVEKSDAGASLKTARIGEFLDEETIDAFYPERFPEGMETVELGAFLRGQTPINGGRVAGGWRALPKDAVISGQWRRGGDDVANFGHVASAYGFLARPTSPEASENFGVVARVVDPSGATPQSFTTLQAALADVRGGGG